ncbi:MAG TPA: methyltransferase domain-containing protein [Gallionella sp.]|nr:methyltransferase domain-containing protein [Gallionella sp.]
MSSNSNEYQTNSNQWPEHAAAPNTHNRVFELVRQYLTAPEGKKVCDLPCGAGAFSARLAQLGADITAVDIEAVEPFYYDRGHRILADANLPLPFADGEFDAMVSIEGIEHLENPSFFLRECARVVKPGGLVFLSTPNIDSFRSRRSTFLHGFPKYFRPKTADRKDAYHLHPIDMTFVRGALRKTDLSIVELAVNRFSGRNIFRELLRPLFTAKLPEEMRGQIPFYGEVLIYVLRKKVAEVSAGEGALPHRESDFA